MGVSVSEQFLSLVLFAMAMTFSPGSNNVLMASSGVQVGLRRSVPLGLGVVAGIVLLLTVSAVGLGSLVHAEPSIRVGIKMVGAAYLVWLGWKIAHAGAPDLSAPERQPRRGFLAGFVNTLLNPKGWTMALSATAGYAALAPSAPRLALVLSLVFAVIAVPNWLLWCGGGQAVSRTLRTDRSWRIANTVLGLFVVVSIVPMWLE
jgi:threonine/homoserine/homoserine lactone efflux protein